MFTITNRVNQLAKTVKRERKNFLQIKFLIETFMGLISIKSAQNPSKSIENHDFMTFFRISNFMNFYLFQKKIGMLGYLRLELRKNKFTKKSHGWRQTHGKCIF